jgi:glycine cleavage system H lipoate-binding protein/ABC-type phosphate transport system substrate-binding protein
MHNNPEIMKTIFSLIAGFFLLFVTGSAVSKQVKNTDDGLQAKPIEVQATPDLINLTSKWVSEYSNINPQIKLNVSNTAENNKELGENLSFVTDKSSDATVNEAYWRMIVGHDIIVPVMNNKNPFIQEIMQKGISPEMFAGIFQNPGLRNWGTIMKNKAMDAHPVHLYIINNESIITGLEKFLGDKQIQQNGIVTGNRDQVISGIQNDPYAIGFCKLVDIQGTENQSLAENIRLLPVDKNGNGGIDYMENIYGDLNSFQRGVWIGKYPRALCSNIYAICKAQPVNENEVSFLKWVLTDGQKFNNANGYSDLAISESQSQMDKINMAVITETTPKEAHSELLLVLFVLLSLIVLGISLNALVRSLKNRKKIAALAEPDTMSGFDEKTVLIPAGLYYDKTHTWAFMEKDGMVTIGIDDFLQHITGPVTRIETKQPGEKFKKGDHVFSIIQDGKHLNLYAPVSGTIKKLNEDLGINSSYLNSSPYGNGWVYMIEPSNWFGEIHLLEMSEKYKRWLGAEFTRLKDFMAAILHTEDLQLAHILMQDGGSLKDGLLSDLSPEAWDDFQTNFLDTFK